MNFKPENGMLVQARGRVSLFEARGNYQLIADSLVRSGEGLLRAKFELLKNSLASEGLFADSHKKALPAFPLRIAVVTSPSGAALRDILNVLQRRWPLAAVRVYGVPVQGVEAAPAIVDALDAVNEHNWAQVIVTGRGGGSLEDLWAFNEEVVARAIAASEIPIISAVGHEIDFTIADFVADVRAPTPSAAAELAVPVQSELKMQMTRLSARLGGSLQNRALVLREKIPGFRQTMGHALRSGVQQRQQRVDQAALTLSHRLQSAVAEQKQDLKRLEVQLRALSPLGVLDRGYSLTETADGTVVRDASDLKKGDAIRTRFAKGTVLSEVTNNHGVLE